MDSLITRMKINKWLCKCYFILVFFLHQNKLVFLHNKVLSSSRQWLIMFNIVKEHSHLAYEEKHKPLIDCFTFKYPLLVCGHASSWMSHIFLM